MSYALGMLVLIALQAYTSTALPPCVCTRNLRPVCGSDGKTYSNECLLNCERFKSNANLTVGRDGPCNADQQACVCTFEYKPVCGNDGNTYPNRCSLVCKRSANPDIDVVAEGECVDEVKVAQIPPCVCTDDITPVCGTDGNTYDNACILNCQTAKYPSLGIEHSGKCDDRVRVVNPMLSDQPTCPCPRNMKPVCGSNGVTYNNECLLRCAGAQVTLAKQAPC